MPIRTTKREVFPQNNHGLAADDDELRKKPAGRNDLFKTTVSAAIRSIVRNSSLRVSFEGEAEHKAAHAVGSEICLPDLPLHSTRADFTLLRGNADFSALALLFHNEELHRQLRPEDSATWPAFDGAEQARIEALGTSQMEGMKVNLSARLAAEFAARKKDPFLKERRGAMLGVASRLVFAESIADLTPPEHVDPQLQDMSRLIRERAEPFLQQARQAIGNQFEFAFAVYETLHVIDLLKKKVTKAELRARVRELLEEFDPSQLVRKKKASSIHTDHKKRKDAESLELPEERAAPSRLDSNVDAVPLLQYRVYTTENDEIAAAETFASPNELAQLRANLDSHLAEIRSTMGRLANQLQRRIQSLQSRRWDFDQEEGILDLARLTRVVTEPLQPLSFKQEQDSEFPSTVATLLLDNSGSMRGQSIIVAACCADVLAQSLERCGIRLEILGFTTAQWNGGQSRQQWACSGRQTFPGRVTDLRHIIYKSADTPWRRSRTALGLMLKEDILKENIDGEALLWAHERLLKRPESRRILIVVSDGAPADHSTLTLNDREYLNRHLREVVRSIQSDKTVELLAIGIGHDVGKSYRQAVQIDSVAELVPVLTQQFTKLLVPAA